MENLINLKVLFWLLFVKLHDINTFEANMMIILKITLKKKGLSAQFNSLSRV